MQIKNYRDHHDEIVQSVGTIIETIFDENTLVIYDIRSSIIESVLPHIPYVATYDQRVISLLHHATLVCSDPIDLDVIMHYKQFWLCSKAEIIALPHQSSMTLVQQILQDETLCATLKTRWFKKMITFLPTEESEQLASKIWIPMFNSYDVSQLANDKVLLKEYTIDAWIAHLPWIITDDVDIMQEYFKKDTNYFLKLSHWVSWFWFFDNKKNSVEEMVTACSWQKIIIEEKINLLDSPSMQFFCWEEEILLLWVTDQILEEGRYYNGNKYPSKRQEGVVGDKIITVSEVVVKYIHTLWYRWFWGIDLMVDENNEVYVAEVNARFTWATPALLVNILLRQTLTNSRIFLLLDDSTIDNMLHHKSDNHFPICIGGVNEWWKAQYLQWL